MADSLTKIFYYLLMLFLPLASHADSLNEELLKLDVRLQERPNDVTLLMDKAYLLSQGREFDHALALYEKVLLVENTNLRALTELCVLYTEIHNKEKAIDNCERAIRVSPEEGLLYDNLGLSYLRLGDARASLKPFTEALAFLPMSPRPRYHMGLSSLALKEYEIAYVFFTNLLETELTAAEEALVQHGLYRLHMARKDYDHAHASARRVYALTGDELYLGIIVLSFFKAHQFAVFSVVAILLLWFCSYFGNRLNRFLKNE